MGVRAAGLLVGVASFGVLAAACGSGAPSASHSPPRHPTTTSTTRPSRSTTTTTSVAARSTLPPPTTTTPHPAPTTPPTTAPAPTPTTVSPTTTSPGPTTTAPAQPQLLALLGATPAVQPSSVALTQDGTTYLDGLTWSSWSAGGAQGSGTFHQTQCVPNCASGTSKAYPATVTLSAASHTANGYVFTHMTLNTPGAPQPSQSLTLPR